MLKKTRKKQVEKVVYEIVLKLAVEEQQWNKKSNNSSISNHQRKINLEN